MTAMAFVLAGMAQAATVFVETWDSGTSDPLIWTNHEGSEPNINFRATSRLEEVAPGNWAYYSQADNQANLEWTAYIRDTGTSFTRGNDLRCTFISWFNQNFSPWGGWPYYSGFNGPWHVDTGASLSYYSQAAGVRTPWDGANYFFAQTGDPWNLGGVVFPDAWKPFFIEAKNQGAAIGYRVTLGNTTGAMCEWTEDGVTWNLVADDRETSPSTYNTNPVWLGFGMGSMRTYVDNIVVDTNGTWTMPALAAAEGTMYSDVSKRELLVTFNKTMGASATDGANYTISGPGMGTLAANPDTVTLISGNQYRLRWNAGEMALGENVTVNAVGVRDDEEGIPAFGDRTVVAVPVTMSTFKME
jgi:hypothetical protein